MNRLDVLVLAGFLLIAFGLYQIYPPLTPVFVGIICLQIARTRGAKLSAKGK